MSSSIKKRCYRCFNDFPILDDTHFCWPSPRSAQQFLLAEFDDFPFFQPQEAALLPPPWVAPTVEHRHHKRQESNFGRSATNAEPVFNFSSSLDNALSSAAKLSELANSCSFNSKSVVPLPPVVKRGAIELISRVIREEVKAPLRSILKPPSESFPIREPSKRAAEPERVSPVKRKVTKSNIPETNSESKTTLRRSPRSKRRAPLDADGDVFEVEQIVDHFDDNELGRQFRVRYAGYGPDGDRWHDRTSLCNAENAVCDYEESLKKSQVRQ